eukprot:79741-Amphidinium_carterae.1
MGVMNKGTELFNVCAHGSLLYEQLEQLVLCPWHHVAARRQKQQIAATQDYGPENIRSAPSYFHMGRVFQSHQKLDRAAAFYTKVPCVRLHSLPLGVPNVTRTVCDPLGLFHEQNSAGVLSMAKLLHEQ